MVQRERCQGTRAALTSVAISPDGRRIVSGSGGNLNTVKIWDAETGQDMLTLTGHSGAVNCVSFSPGGIRIVTGNDDTSLEV
jgi:WD40 repeat protein